MTQVRALGTTLGLLLVAPSLLRGQNAPPLTTQLHDWGDQVWIEFLDREGGAGGRFSDKGVLRRFDPLIDEEYRLDLLSRDFTLAEDAEWWSHEAGFRWRAGSITKRDLAINAQLKAGVPLSNRWRLGIRIDMQRNPQADRTLVRGVFTREFGRGFGGFINASLEERKPGSDLEVGARWHSRDGSAHAAVSLAALDWLSDFIYVNLHAARNSEIDSTRLYLQQPLAARAVFTLPLGSAVRVAGNGAYVRPSSAEEYYRELTDSGFVQNERMGFGGVLVEWRVFPALRVGGMANYVRSHIDRSRLSPGSPVDEFGLVEQETQVGPMASAALGHHIVLDAMALRVRRTQERDDRTAPAASVDYEDRSWLGHVTLARRVERGFIADVRLLFDTKDIVRGRGQPPGGDASYDPHEWRAAFNIGWRFGDQAAAEVGVGYDLDGDGAGRRFDGLRGRFNLYW